MVCMLKKKKMYPTYISKHNSNRENQVILLMIANGEEREVKSEGQWHYLAVNKLSALLREIASKNSGVFYCLSCFNFFRRKNKLESHKKVCNINNFVLL